MAADVEIASYNLTMVLEVQSESGRITGSREDFVQIMRDPLPIQSADDALVFSSSRDQLILAFQPPGALLADVSGEWPARVTFDEALNKMIGFLAQQAVVIPSYGWNIEAVLRDVELGSVMGGLFDSSRVDDILGGIVEPHWFVPRVEFTSDSTFSDKATLGLRPHPSEDDIWTLRFNLNSHFDREIKDGTVLSEQARDFAENARAMLARLNG